MSENWQIALTGYGVAVVTYLAKNFIFQPLLEFRATKGKIQNRLKYNANKYFNGLPPEISREAFDELRQLSCDLEEKYQMIAWRQILALLWVVPKKNKLSEAARNMIYISNSPDVDSNEKKHAAFENIKKVLKIL